MINLALSSKKDVSASTLRLRQLITRGTSIVLGLWVVGLGAFLGWTWYVNTHSARVDKQLKDLQTQVAGLSDEEILVRKLAARTTSVKQFLDSRGDPVKNLDVVLLATPPAIAWDYKNANTQTISVSAPSVQEIQGFVDTVSGFYNTVTLDSLGLVKSVGWTGKVTVGGLKK